MAYDVEYIKQLKTGIEDAQGMMQYHMEQSKLYRKLMYDLSRRLNDVRQENREHNEEAGRDE